MEEGGAGARGSPNWEVYCDQYISGDAFCLHLPFFALSVDCRVGADISNWMTTWQLVSPLSDRSLAGPGPEISGVGVRRHSWPSDPATPFVGASGRACFSGRAGEASTASSTWPSLLTSFWLTQKHNQYFKEENVSEPPKQSE